MKLFHIASKKNQASIEKRGLLPSKAKGKEKAVWMVTAGNILWALAHTAAKPGRGGIESLIVYEIKISRSEVRRYRRGIYRAFRTIKVSNPLSSAAWTGSYPG